MKKLFAIGLIVAGIALPFAMAVGTAEAGGRHRASGWAGHDWGDTYPGWAAEAFQPGH